MGHIGRERKVVIGRAASCGVVLNHETVSRVHAELIATESGLLFLIDCHSRNGTFRVRGKTKTRVRQELVDKKDSLMFGDVRMRVADLLPKVAFERKSPAAKPARSETTNRSAQPAQPAQSIQSVQSVHEFPRSRRLIRCACGAIKEAGRPCEECGR